MESPTKNNCHLARRNSGNRRHAGRRIDAYHRLFKHRHQQTEADHPRGKAREKPLELKGSGGRTVDIVETEGGFLLKTVVIKPTALYKALGLTEDDYDSKGRMKVKTHIVQKRKAMRFIPLRVGAMGIEAPVTQVSFKPSDPRRRAILPK